MKGNQFERIVQAIIFSFFIGIFVFVIKNISIGVGVFFQVGIWSDDVAKFWSALIALLLGLYASYLANTDKIMPTLRRFKFTSRTTYPSEWYQALHEHRSWLVIHLKDGRRLAGYPRLWPNDNDSGYFDILQPSWLEAGKDIPIEGCLSIIMPAKEVLWLELLEEIDG